MFATHSAVANEGRYFCPIIVHPSSEIDLADAIDDLAFESEADVHPGLLAILEWNTNGSASFADHLSSKQMSTTKRAELMHLSTVPLDQLKPDEWTELVHSIWDPRRFETDRRVPFLRVRKQMTVPISQSGGHRSPLSVLSERYPKIIHQDAKGEAYIIELGKFFETDNIHFQAPNAPERVLEMHFRFKLPELGMKFEDLDQFFRLLLPVVGIKTTDAHLHVVHALHKTRARFKASPANEQSIALAWTYWVKLVNQILDLQDVRLGRTVDTVWDEKTATIFYSNFKAPYFLFEQFKKALHGVKPSKNDRVLGHISFHPHGSYDSPMVAGAEIRNIEWGSQMLPSRETSGYQTFALQKQIKESFQLEKALDWTSRMEQWSGSVRARGLDPFQYGLTWDHSELPHWKPSPEYRSQVGAIAEDPLFQMNGPGSARAYFIKRKINHSLELLFHDWCLDPLFYGKPECRAIYALQRESLQAIRNLYQTAYRRGSPLFGWMYGTRISFYQYVEANALHHISDIQTIVQQFVRQAKLLEQSLEELR